MPARQRDEQQPEDAAVPSLAAQTVRRADSRAQVVEGESSSGVEAAPDSAAGVAASVPAVSTAQPTSNDAAADQPAVAAVERAVVCSSAGVVLLSCMAVLVIVRVCCMLAAAALQPPQGAHALAVGGIRHRIRRMISRHH